MTPLKIFIRSTVAAVTVLFSFSCENDVNEVKELTKSNEFPMEVQENLVLTYSDSSYTRMELKADLAENYPQLEEPKLVFSKGIEVRFFDAYGQEDSRLRADHAIQYPEKRMWVATGDVVVLNKKGERLNTEKLYWDEKEEKIWSDVQSKITTGKEQIWGEYFEADQNFTEYKIENITGEVTLDEDE